jgi:hypothetical protein
MRTCVPPTSAAMNERSAAIDPDGSGLAMAATQSPEHVSGWRTGTAAIRLRPSLAS